MESLTYESGIPDRLDRFLVTSNPNLSRSFIAKQISKGDVLVNGVSSKASYKLKLADKISFNKQSLSVEQPQAISLPVIYEDDFCIVINKPSGIITHAKGAMSNESSVASFIQGLVSPELIGNRAGIVHRLDRGTSGVIIAAKTERAQKYLQSQFAKRQVSKTYYAVVSGTLDKKEAQINMPIERNPKHPSTFRVGPNGKAAETYYETIDSNGSYTLIKLSPKTGRTHQLRVHLKAIGHPIVGDTFYDGEQNERLMLHAAELIVILPDIGKVPFSAPLPLEFKNFINS